MAIVDNNQTHRHSQLRSFTAASLSQYHSTTVEIRSSQFVTISVRAFTAKNSDRYDVDSFQNECAVRYVRFVTGRRNLYSLTGAMAMAAGRGLDWFSVGVGHAVVSDGR